MSTSDVIVTYPVEVNNEPPKFVENSDSSSYNKFKLYGLIGGPLALLMILSLPQPSGISLQAWQVIGCAALMITWWITEAIPIAATSLLPLVLFPALGIFDIKESAAPYSSPAVFLYMGGFMLATTIERWRLHIRIALNVVKLTGTNANGIIGGFVIATGVLSMWMSNTATVVMMLPISLSVVNLLLKGHNTDSKKDEGYQNFATSMMLGIAYAASIGGIATIIGTPTNTIFSNFMRESFNYEVSFGKWMLIGVPFAAIMLFANWLLLVKVFYPNKLGNLEGSKEVIQNELRNLGPMSTAEKRVAIIFLATALLWCFRSVINEFIPLGNLTDEGVAILSALALFITPVNLKEGKFLLDWKTAETLPWGILLLFGGGLSLANGFESTGLVNWLGSSISGFGSLGVLQLIIIVSFLAVFLTEFMSNMALVTIFLPVLASVAIGFNVSPLLLAIPVTISASCAFMLPMSTPPNAIVFGSGHVKISQMIKAGIWLNLIGIVLVVILAYTLSVWVFDIDFNSLPDWVTKPALTNR